MSRSATYAVRTARGWITDWDYRIWFEPSPRRVRAVLGDVSVADSLALMVLLEQGHLPVYYFPLRDVRMDLLTPTDHKTHCPHKGEACYWTVEAGGKTAGNAAWAYPEPLPHLSGLEDYMAFYWGKMDRWLEEDEEVFVHPRDPRKRVDVVDSGRRVQVLLGGQIIADSTSARFLFETDLPTRYYLPEEDVRMDLLVRTGTRTRCPYKGQARYWSVTMNGRTFEDVVWSYPDPIAECPRIAGRLSFFNEVVDDILVDGAPVPKERTKWSRD